MSNAFYTQQQLEALSSKNCRVIVEELGIIPENNKESNIALILEFQEDFAKRPEAEALAKQYGFSIEWGSSYHKIGFNGKFKGGGTTSQGIIKVINGLVQADLERQAAIEKGGLISEILKLKDQM